ncbi:flagellar biosynthesis protein FlgL [Sulfurimonas sp. SWIR-19]|uniref:flagellin N-terminal helical domain-containing protein n=1 Tax=Sulfurimonas sp. SWIR-19 TaxID=2878390 RepID=UPI001CF2076A|nr:flagellar biosynthesis protein FlgL [Sulfurimonas sp. SWIR-19]UCM99225.1 flagellar biosynthesis protein FlgL [Sulfurimonas sp. SWIR-19]
MRVTSSMYYNSLYATNNLKINNELFDVNKQIASGLKIQYAKDDVRTFTETMRLDNELVTIGQVKKSTESGYKISNQTDVVLNEFETSLDRMKTLLINAANGTHSPDSLDAIAGELRGLEKHFKNLANTSINGQFLFSGSAVNTKPIDANGIYQGNDAGMNSVLGSNSTQKYNLTGAELFLGEEQNTKREITTNVINNDLINGGIITQESSIRDLMGDIDDNTDTINNNYFYIRGTKSDGTAFKEKVKLDDTRKVGELLDEIGKLYGNTGNVNVVNVSLNSNGQIIIEDKIKGSSKLDFHMVGAVDFDDNTATSRANVTDVDILNSGESDYVKVKDDTDGSTNHLFVKEFIKSGFTPASGVTNNIEGILYDRTSFTAEGSKLSSNVPQVIKTDNSFAQPSTALSEVFDLSQNNTGTLDGTTFNLVGNDISGVQYTATIDLKSSANGGSQFSVDTNGDGIVDTSYDIFDMQTPRAAVDADKMTYQQLMDVVNMVVTKKLPTSNTANAYDAAIKDSNNVGNTNLSYDGKITFHDLTSGATQASIALYDKNTNDFTQPSSVGTFQSNNTLTVVDPKTDFFKNLDEAITAVEDHKLYPDSSSGNMRNQGIENALAAIDKLQSHVSRSHSVVGAQSNTLNTSLERTSLLEVSTMTLRSEVIDTDIAEASLRLSQLNLNYQAMLSTVGKISQLSLVNYL